MRFVANPYADLSALLDSTRRLTHEEMAELHLEQGYVDRALRIYDELTEKEPGNATYAMRRAWLARLTAVRPVRLVGVTSPDERMPRLAKVRASEPPPPRARASTLEGVGPVAERDESAASQVRALRIVGVR